MATRARRARAYPPLDDGEEEKVPGVGNHDNPGVGLGRQILCVLSTRT